MNKILFSLLFSALIFNISFAQDNISEKLINTKLSLLTDSENEPGNKISLKNFNRRILGDTNIVPLGYTNKDEINQLKFDSSYVPKKNFLIPVAEIIVLNFGVWSMSRYISPQPWAVISTNSIKENFKYMWVWDSDNFATNQFMHPYHGNTYFNFARSSGLNFWQSAPYSLGGSLMWELFMETNYPSKNDLISTTLGGIALGEMTYRLSSKIIDERKTGSERVWREIGAFLLAPTRGINRFFRGEMSRVKQKSSYEIEDVYSTISIGPSFYYKMGQLYQGNGNLSLRLDLYYGNPYINKSRKPYDFFNVKTIFSVGTQPLINQVNVYGLIFGKNYRYKADQKILIGMFQHFDYYDNTNYRIGAQSIGAGIIYRIPTVSAVNFETSIHLAGIVLGGGSNIEEAFKYEADGTAYRDYNFGMGYSNKVETMLTIKNRGYLFLGLYNYTIYTIDGADGRDNLLMFTPRVAFALNEKTNLGFEYNYYRRASYYVKYNNFFTNVFEMKLFISNNF